MPDIATDVLASLHPVVREHALLPSPVAFDDRDPQPARASVVQQLDESFERWGRKEAAVADERELTITESSTDTGDRVRVAVYHPAPDTRLGLHIHLHGGGWRTGSIDERCTRHFARRLAARAPVAVATVGYRLAPEHPWPVGLRDVMTAVDTLRERADEFNIDATRLTIGGVSAGANLAAAAVVAGVPARGLVLEVPALDLTADTLLSAEPDFPREQIAGVLDSYLPDRSKATDPLVSPLRTPDVSGFPPTWLFSAELDLLRHDAVAFERRLTESGVPTSHRQYAGALHGSGILTGAWPIAAQWQDDVISAIGAAQAERTGGRGD